MIYKLDHKTLVISPVSLSEARKALLAAGWKDASIDEMSRSSKMLWTDAAHYGAVEFYLKEKRDELRRKGAGSEGGNLFYA